MFSNDDVLMEFAFGEDDIQGVGEDEDIPRELNVIIQDLTPQVSSNSQTISSNMDTIRQEGKLETFGAIEETLLFDYQDNKENACSNIRRSNKQEIQCIQPIVNQAKDKNIKVNEAQCKAAVQPNTKDYVIFDIK